MISVHAAESERGGDGHLAREFTIDGITSVEKLCKPSRKVAIYCHPLPFMAEKLSDSS